MEKRILIAPNLDSAHLGARLVCHRPCRRGPPRICVEYRGERDQLIAHNYGHAGSGWTVGPGVAEHSVQQMGKAVEERRQKGFIKPKGVTVIGAGVIGLYTAYNLIRSGFETVNVVAEQLDDLPSHKAGGLLAPTPCNAVFDPNSQALFDQCAVDSYRFYIAISHGVYPDFPRECAKQIPAYFDFGSAHGLDLYIRSKVLRPPKKVKVQFGNCPSANSHQMVAFDDNIFLNTRLIMRTLRQLLTRKGVTFVRRRVASFDELDEHSVVMNCAGIGAKELCGDEEVHSVQGHLIMLKDQNPGELNYLIHHMFGKGITTESGHSVVRNFYLFPKRSSNQMEKDDDGKYVDIGLIGGTFVKDCGPETLNLSEFDVIVQNAIKFIFGETQSKM